MATVRAKFVCNYKKDEYVSFSPVHSGSPENDSFEEGKSYYVDFTPAES